MTTTTPRNHETETETGTGTGWRRHWGRIPVRWRLTAWYALFLAGALLLFGAVIYVGLRYNLYHALDEQVTDQTALIRATVQERDGRLFLAPGDTGELENDESFVRLLTDDGEIVTDTSTNLGGVPLDQDLIEAALSGQTRLTSAHADGHTIRIVTTPVVVNGEVRGALQVGTSREEIDEALRSLIVLLLVAGPIVLAGAVAGGYLLAGRAMAPVGEITRLAAAIDGDDLHTRLDLDLPDDELGRLAGTFDAMLARIEDAFERQRRFTGDAAHELRTPLSLLRSQVDLALLHPRTDDEYRAALRALQEDLDRLTGLVGTLLTLARADAGQLALSPAPFDLAATVDLVAEQFAPQAAAAGVTLHRETNPCPVVADEDLLVQVLVNLVANALAHTPPGGTVTLGCRFNSAAAHLWVADTGSGIALEHQARVFDRFYRVHPARSRAHGGAGLGLSITRTIVEAHGGKIVLTSAPGKGTTVEVALPAQSNATNPQPSAGRLKSDVH
ncbi:MAG: sensor histidine kinase [Thermomicrobiales bacterium]